MIIETKYNTIDDFICQFNGVIIVSVEFEHDFARYTLQFRDWVEETYFKKRFEQYTNKMSYLNNCLKIQNYKTNLEKTINISLINDIDKYKSIKKDSNIYRQIQKLVEGLNNDTFM